MASGVATSPVEVEKYASCTMLAASLAANKEAGEAIASSQQATGDSILGCVKFLEDNEFIRLQQVTEDVNSDAPSTTSGSTQTRYVATQLGLACLASSLSPDEGLKVFTELQTARKCFVLENELHILYQVVPIYAAVSWPNLDWMNYLSLWEALPADIKRVGELIGVEERFLVRAMRGTISNQTPKQVRQMAIHQRFYTALALHDLVNEAPLKIVSQKYGASKGMLQSLQQASSTFAGMVTAFCHKLGWLNLELLLGQFQDRLQFGVHRELIDLCRLTTLNGQRARILHNAKLETVAMLANSSASDVENILTNAMPFESKKQGENESEAETARRRTVRSFWVTGQKGLTIAEAAVVIVDEARDILQKDLGMEINWESSQERQRNLSALMNESKSKNTSKSFFKGKKGSKKGSGGNTSRFKKGKPTDSRLLSHYTRKTKPVVGASGGGASTSRRKSSSNSTMLSPVLKRSPHLAVLAQTKQILQSDEMPSSRKVQRLSMSHKSPSTSKPTTPIAVIGTPLSQAAGFQKATTLLQTATTPGNRVGDNPETPGSANKKVEMSFDLTGQIEEIFENEMLNESDLVPDLNNENRNAAVEASASPILHRKKPTRDDVFLKPPVQADQLLRSTSTPGPIGAKTKVVPERTFSEDIFGDESFVEDPAEIDRLLAQTSTSRNKDSHSNRKSEVSPSILCQSRSNKSCPETPKFEVCSEELGLRITSDFSDIQDTPKDSHNASTVDQTISDSFLERAMDSHMSEADYAEAASNHKTNAKVLQNLTQSFTNNKDDQGFLIPSPVVVSCLPKDSKINTPKSDKSSRLSRRRQTQKSKVTKFSPGCLIISDSDSDCVQDSPANKPSKKPTEPVNSQIFPKSQFDFSQLDSDLNVVDVCADRAIFDSFVSEWREQGEFSLALACSKPTNPPAAAPTESLGIGARITRKRGAAPKSKGGVAGENDNLLTLGDFGVKVEGIAISWESASVFYVSLSSEQAEDPKNQFAAPKNDLSISLEEKVAAIKSVLEKPKRQSGLDISAFDVKCLFKLIYLSLGILIHSGNKTRIPVQISDPKVAVWMLQPVEKEKNLSNIVMNYDQTSVPLLDTLGSAPGCGSVALNPEARQPARVRAVTEAILVRRIVKRLLVELKSVGMLDSFRNVEMPSVLTLARMELNGVGFSDDESERQRKIITARMEELEAEAYKLANHDFSLTSPEDICQVLYRELKLPLNGDPSLGSYRPGVRNVRNKNSKLNPSSSKDILIKLKAYHELPAIILEWRKLNMTISKVVYPMQRSKSAHPRLAMDRIYTNCVTQTATGRISLHEPNIQNIPRDFDIVLTEKLKEKALGRREARLLGSNNSSSFSGSVLSPLSSYLEESHDSRYVVSMRHAIVPTSGSVILAADYSQIELRILADLSGDEKLLRILNAGADVFKSIAASWKRTDINEISEDERAQAKQICYGMIYGIGTASLGDQLGVVEEEASVFLHSFKSAYPGVKKFMDTTLTACKRVGFVSTMSGRRRYLPQITGGANQFARAAAERQAINTTIQGSAADLVKSAMNEIDRRLFEAFPRCQIPLRMSNWSEQKRNKVPNDSPSEGAYFLLQMHDELIYEVACEDVIQVAQIVRLSMETACKLKVKTPVKIKVGPS